MNPTFTELTELKTDVLCINTAETLHDVFMMNSEVVGKAAVAITLPGLAPP